MWEIQVQSLGWEDLLEKEMATHSSTLASKIPWSEDPGRLQSMGSQRVGHDWATSLSLSMETQDIENRLLDTVGEGEGGTNWETSMETYTFSWFQSLSLVWLCNPLNSSTPGLPIHYQLFASGGLSIAVSASASFLPKNTQGWSPLGWTGWISLQSKGLLRDFSNTAVQKHQFFGPQLSPLSNSHINIRPLEKS